MSSIIRFLLFEIKRVLVYDSAIFLYFLRFFYFILFHLKFVFRQEVIKKGKKFMFSEMESKEFEPRFKSAKTRFKFSAGLNLETFDTILSGTNHI